ncbi:hypothetical protein DdX_21392 [Ditylenchus destructor]|uniref:Uncharacterized protein n=1 Tax=Ditylenchus destructor TaxID=166010 RepID=A0AAD4MFV3_9BILA|nr:hypothetical protein DdX_21392 [Ditylenchus destructor]
MTFVLAGTLAEIGSVVVSSGGCELRPAGCVEHLDEGPRTGLAVVSAYTRRPPGWAPIPVSSAAAMHAIKPDAKEMRSLMVVLPSFQLPGAPKDWPAPATEDATSA